VFAPVVVPGRSEGADMSAGGVIEIELSGGRRLRVDRHVDAEALRRVLAVLGR
jgi:transposase